MDTETTRQMQDALQAAVTRMNGNGSNGSGESKGFSPDMMGVVMSVLGKLLQGSESSEELVEKLDAMQKGDITALREQVQVLLRGTGAPDHGGAAGVVDGEHGERIVAAVRHVHEATVRLHHDLRGRDAIARRVRRTGDTSRRIAAPSALSSNSRPASSRSPIATGSNGAGATRKSTPGVTVTAFCLSIRSN